MTAQKELQIWLEQYRQLDNEDAREQFYQNLLARLGEKDSDSLREGLLALKKSVRASRIKAEKPLLDRRIAENQANPDASIPWQEFVQQLKNGN